MFVVYFLFTLTLLYPGSAINTVPSNFPICHRDDPKMNECLVAAANQVRPYLINGVPELKLPSLNPLYMPMIELHQGTSSLKYNLTLHNVSIYGLGNYEATKLEFDMNTLLFVCEMKIPALFLDAKINIQGRIIMADIGGAGIFRANVSDLEIKFSEKEKLSKKQGNSFLIPIETDVKVKIGKVNDLKIQLFDSNKSLQDTISKMLADNLDVLLEDFSPAIEGVVSSIVDDFIKKSLGRVPYDSLYPLMKGGA